MQTRAFEVGGYRFLVQFTGEIPGVNEPFAIDSLIRRAHTAAFVVDASPIETIDDVVEADTDAYQTLLLVLQRTLPGMLAASMENRLIPLIDLVEVAKQQSYATEKAQEDFQKLLADFSTFDMRMLKQDAEALQFYVADLKQLIHNE